MITVKFIKQMKKMFAGQQMKCWITKEAECPLWR